MNLAVLLMDAAKRAVSALGQMTRGVFSLVLGIALAPAAGAQASMDLPEGNGLSAEPAMPLARGVALISIAVIVVICAFLVAALIRQRARDGRARELVDRCQNIARQSLGASESRWRRFLR